MSSPSPSPPLLREKTIEKVLNRCVEEGRFRCETIDQHPVAVLYDEDLLLETAKAVSDAFLEQSEGEIEFLHCAALKACPVGGVLDVLASYNKNENRPTKHGAECASIGEVVLAQKHFPNENIVFDSPCKTIPELKYALSNSVHLNIDSLQELERVKLILLESGETHKGGSIGLRVNPLVGAGALGMFSVATLHSKFGIPITSITAEEVAALPWINCLMLHTGSHGCGLDLLVDGVAKVVDFATKVNEISKKKRGAAQIRTFDIGGGVPAILSTENEICKFREYAQSLKERCPQLFSGQFSKIVTEFGASMFARTGWVASRVEYTKEIIDEDKRRRTLVIIHAGADLFLRKCYAGTGCHPLSLHSPKGELSPVVELGEKHSLFGPLCFSGDELSEKNGSVEFARQAVPGDIVVVHNAGANVISLFNHHCSRNASQVIIFRSNEGDITLSSVRSEDSVQGTVAFWG